MDGRKLKELISRIPDDAEVVHLWDGGFSWRCHGELKVYSFLSESVTEN